MVVLNGTHQSSFFLFINSRREGGWYNWDIIPILQSPNTQFSVLVDSLKTIMEGITAVSIHFLLPMKDWVNQKVFVISFYHIHLTYILMKTNVKLPPALRCVSWMMRLWEAPVLRRGPPTQPVFGELPQETLLTVTWIWRCSPSHH